MYDAGTDPYLDPATGILRNNLGITTQDELDKAEADISTAVLAGLVDNPISGNFDLKHLQAIHKALFGSLYPWAGELRTVELAKDDTRFANPEFLAKAAVAVFDKLHSENRLRNLPNEQYIERLAHYFSEINILHPFREGNGRTQRTFFTLLTAESGHRIKWEEMDPAVNLKASIAAYQGEESGLVTMLTALVVPAN
jgi:cell filamentation protein